MDLKNDAPVLELLTPVGRDFKMLTDAAHVPFYLRNNDEGYSADLLLRRCTDGGTFLDVGAHHGYYTLLVATQRTRCRVLAFEPVPDNCRILKRNLGINSATNVAVFNAAVSDQTGRRAFRIREFSSHGSLYDDHISGTVQTVEVETLSLDQSLKNTLKTPIVVKIDAEGHEQHVVMGMTKLLTDAEDATLLVEFNPIVLRKAGEDPDALLQLIASLGFEAYFIDDELRRTYRVDDARLGQWESYLQEGNFGKGYFNVLYVKKARSLSVCLFSPSSELGEKEERLLDMTSQMIDKRGAFCCLALPAEGPLKARLEAAGACVMVAAFAPWCGIGPSNSENARTPYTDDLISLAGLIDPIDKINPHAVLTNTMMIPWGAMMASLLGKPHVWYIAGAEEVEDRLVFDLPLSTVKDIIRDSSACIITDSDSARTRLFGASPSQGVFCTLPNDNSTREQRGNALYEMFARLKDRPNPVQAWPGFSRQVIRDLLAKKNADNLPFLKELESLRLDLVALKEQNDATALLLEASHHELALVTSSLYWAVATRLNTGIDFLLPPQSRRRTLAGRVARAVLGLDRKKPNVAGEGPDDSHPSQTG